MENQLNRCFATLFSLYLKTHRYHWLVKGTDFPQLHELFGDQYTAVWTSLDSFAERINFYHYTPASTYEDLQNSSVINISSNVPDSLSMVKELANDHNVVIENLKQLFETIEQTANDQALMNFIADLLDQHQKHRWMLENICNVQMQLNDEQVQDTIEDQEPMVAQPVNNVLGSAQGNHMRNLLDIFK